MILKKKIMNNAMPYVRLFNVRISKIFSIKASSNDLAEVETFG